MSLQSAIETATSPPVAVPITTTGAAASLIFDVLPAVTIVGWAIYVVLVVSHKSWQMYKEWSDDPKAPGKGWFK